MRALRIEQVLNGVVDNTHDVVVTVSYDPADPWAVQFHFIGQDKFWTFARELLAFGGGDGDVNISNTPEHLFLRLYGGVATIRFNQADVQKFLSDTFALVPIGIEHTYVDLTTECALLLGGLPNEDR